MKVLKMPPFSMSLGPWIAPSEAKYAKSLSQEKEMMSALIDQLPAGHSFEQNFHYSVQNWLPFFWKGFNQTTAYTYRIPDLSNLEAVWGEFLDNARTDIRKAEKKLTCRSDLPTSEFIRVNRMTFERQGTNPYYSDETLTRIIEGSIAQGKGKTFYSVDSEGKTHSVAFFVFDERSAFYLAGGSDPALRSSGAMSHVMWSAMQFFSGKTKEFNFDGSMMEPVERFFRSFGALQTPYMRVWKHHRPEKLIQFAKGFMKR